MYEGSSDWMDGYKLALLFEKQQKKALYFSHPLQIKVRKQTNKQKKIYTTSEETKKRGFTCSFS